ncbi:LOW QUALITY PROTEIN: hypothetical protein BC937DRAFT_86465 [Endogone sp. FLAS-F59071]|nr:LOW QUALITY PROTEIN: hypothetical protein BC937DRAFT_86465 [Endogone sp. FLAS-F59071]|eukprot:RUS13022.1 LOW QUALITY PROTEIN: hypothetical protein BC937DRAFT_86465 [Endogone sp. FLAS-F59071]
MGSSTSKIAAEPGTKRSDAERTLDMLLERNHRGAWLLNVLWASMSEDVLASCLVEQSSVCEPLRPHVVHRVRTGWELYDSFDKILVPLEPRVTKITDDNWRDFLGDYKYYQDYLDFFDARLSTPDDIPYMMEKYGFQLLKYSIGSAVHPLIHFGFGVEFQKPLVVSEGRCSRVLSLSLSLSIYIYIYDYRLFLTRVFIYTTATHVVICLALALTCINYSTLGDLVDPDETTSDNMTPLDIVEATRLDPAFDSFPKKGELSDEQRALVKQYLDRWNVGDPSKTLDDLLYSLAHVVLLLYATTPVMTPPKPEFFIMHLLTSLHAVQSLLSHLPPTQARTLLKSHLLAILTIYIDCSRPPIHAGRMEELSDGPAGGWDEIARIAIGHPDEHFSKGAEGWGGGVRGKGSRDGEEDVVEEDGMVDVRGGEV